MYKVYHTCDSPTNRATVRPTEEGRLFVAESDDIEHIIHALDGLQGSLRLLHAVFEEQRDDLITTRQRLADQEAHMSNIRQECARVLQHCEDAPGPFAQPLKLVIANIQSLIPDPPTPADGSPYAD